MGLSKARFLVKVKRKALQGVVLLAALFVLISARVVLSARAELAEGERLLEAKDRDAAIVHLRRAARWYAPLSPYHVRALERLAEIGRTAEQAGETERALSAYRALRGAILATRSTYVPERPQLEAANLRIAALMSKQEPPGMDTGKSERQRYEEHLALLTPIPGPNVFWSCVLLLGFVCWVGAAFALSIRGLDGEERWVPREWKRWGGLIAVGFSLFVLGMALV
jgi:hypothetical protein